MKPWALVLLCAIQASADYPAMCYPPKDVDCDQRLVTFMRSAQKTLDVAVYDISLQDVAQAIVDQSKKIKVRVIVDHEQSREPHSQVKWLRAQGVDVRYGHQAGIMHDKYTIVDTVAIETGSYNYTNHATRANHENALYLGWVDVVVEYQKDFDAMWDAARPVAP